ncbi:MAG TPA: DegT/DnrJ/EryC1/StrS aminotransferase family protein [Anaerolineae bacterium]|nr:DegT/DnrJ/EryC1/StrS aminotransferase family protein [Anaerolineae bacterium]
MIHIAKPYIGDSEKQAVQEVLDSGMLAQGKRVADFEKRFAGICDVQWAVATSSGTTALHLALLANGIGPGDEVITSPFTFIASANSILFTGARPVFVDIDEATFNLDMSLVEDAITPRTKAIMPVHLYGQVCDMEELESIADRHNLAIIEDACQAVGGKRFGRKAGSFGTGCFSLYATKNIMSAEGGMITTNDADIAERCRLLRNHGMERRYHYEMLGFNFRMTDIQAAIGLAQADRIEAFTERRRQNANYFNDRIESVITPREKEGNWHVWHQYTIRVVDGRDRDKAVDQLNAAGIGTGIFYPIPAHKHDYMREIVGDVSLPVAERLAGEVISIPVHPQLTDPELNQIVSGVNGL